MRLPDSCFQTLTALLALLATTIGAAGDDWPQFRGPNRDGISHETGLATHWDEDGPSELWRAHLGVGFSGAAVVGTRLYTLATRGEDEEVVCLDAAHGNELWRTAVGPLFSEPTYGDGPRGTPTVKDGKLWTLAATGRLAALSAEGGEILWSVDLTQRFGAETPLFGFAAMPLLVGELVVVEAPGAEGYSAFAFNKENGDLAWRTAAGASGFSSPIFLTQSEANLLLFFNVSGLVALSPGGEFLWRVPFPEHMARIAQPLFVPPDLVFVSAGYDLGAMVVRLTPGSGAEKVWESRTMRTLVSTSVTRDGLVYGFDNSTLKCIEAATGQKRWAKRGGFGNGSLIWADGHLFVLTERGKLLLVEATGDGFREEGAAQQLFNGRTWTPPSLSEGRLFVRGPEEIVALDLHRPESDSSSDATPASEAVAAADAPAEARGFVRDVDAIVARHLEALGGADALSDVRTLRQRGHYVLNGEAYPFTSYHKRPDRYRFEARRPDGDILVVAYDGRTGWRQGGDGPRQLLDMMPSLMRLPPRALALLLDGDADFEGPLVGYRAKGTQVELVGKETLEDGSHVVHLRLTLRSGRVQDWYLSQEDFTVVKKTTAVERDLVVPVLGKLGPYVRHWYYQKYRRVAGVLWPVIYEREDSPLVRTFAAEVIDVNADLDDSLFAMPQVTEKP